MIKYIFCKLKDISIKLYYIIAIAFSLIMITLSMIILAIRLSAFIIVLIGIATIICDILFSTNLIATCMRNFITRL